MSIHFWLIWTIQDDLISENQCSAIHSYVILSSSLPMSSSSLSYLGNLHHYHHHHHHHHSLTASWRPKWCQDRNRRLIGFSLTFRRVVVVLIGAGAFRISSCGISIWFSLVHCHLGHLFEWGLLLRKAVGIPRVKLEFKSYSSAMMMMRMTRMQQCSNNGDDDACWEDDKDDEVGFADYKAKHGFLSFPSDARARKPHQKPPPDTRWQPLQA